MWGKVRKGWHFPFRHNNAILEKYSCNFSSVYPILSKHSKFLIHPSITTTISPNTQKSHPSTHSLSTFPSQPQSLQQLQLNPTSLFTHIYAPKKPFIHLYNLPLHPPQEPFILPILSTRRLTQEPLALWSWSSLVVCHDPHPVEGIWQKTHDEAVWFCSSLQLDDVVCFVIHASPVLDLRTQGFISLSLIHWWWTEALANYCSRVF